MTQFVFTVLIFFWYALQAYILAACVYVISSALIFLVFFARIKRLYMSQEPTDAVIRKTHFVLLIPAHNEERFLPTLLTSIRQLNYPATQFNTVVIADNCTDNTASLARQAGVMCYERFTQERSDKTQALCYASEQLPTQEPFTEAVICIIDADSVLDQNYLIELDKQYARPGAARVVQSYRSVSNAFSSTVSILDAAAEALRQWVIAGTRKLLGQSNFIFGLGCSMRETIFTELMKLPATSLAEDKEWKIYLTTRNIRVDYCPTARLTYEVENDAQAFRKQRDRWLAGYYESLKTHGLGMLVRGIRGANLAQLDLAGDLLQPPRSVLLLAAVVFGLLSHWFARFALVNSWVWLGMVLSFWVYGAIGLRLIGARLHHYLLLFSGFTLVVAVLKSSFAIVLGQGVKQWDATRKATPKV